MRARMLLLVCFALPAQAAAQRLDQNDIVRARITVGDQVRIQIGTVAKEFKFVASRNDTLELVPDAGPNALVPFASVDRLEVKRRRDLSSAAGSGAWRGAVVGAAIGITLGLASGDDPPDGFIVFTAEEKAFFAGWGLGGAGMLVGALIGMAAPGQHWQTVAITNRVSVRPITSPGIGLAIQW